MKASKLAGNDIDRRRLRSRCMALLAKAEAIKQVEAWTEEASYHQASVKSSRSLKAPVSVRELTIREQRIVLESSRIHGLKFPQWVKDPDPKEFECDENSALFT